MVTSTADSPLPPSLLNISHSRCWHGLSSVHFLISEARRKTRVSSSRIFPAIYTLPSHFQFLGVHTYIYVRVRVCVCVSLSVMGQH